jgi:hypothetical protein
MSLRETPQDVLALDKRPDRDRIEATARRLRAICLSQKRPADALSAAGVYARYCTTNIPSWLEDVAFEEALYARFCAEKEVHIRFDGAAFVATALHDVGGHSKWGLAFLKALAAAGRAPSVVITSTISDTIRQQVEALGVEVFVPDRWDDLLSMEVSGELYLCIANDDIVSALLAQRMASAGRRIIFCNHTDHTFSFGASRRREIIEVSGFGYQLSQRARTFSTQSFAGIPIDVEEAARGTDAVHLAETHAANDMPRQLLTIARTGKLRPTAEHNFPKFAAWAVQEFDARHLIVGRTGGESWWGGALKDSRIERLDALLWHEIEELFPSTLAYIDSFPLTGGTVLGQIAMAGLPIFGKKDVPRGWSVVDTVLSADLRELKSDLSLFIETKELPYDPAALRARVVEEHAPAVFMSRVALFLQRQQVECPSWALQDDAAIAGFRRILASAEYPNTVFSAPPFGVRLATLFALFRWRKVADWRHMYVMARSLLGSRSRPARMFRFVKAQLS